ncbi:hypothetical protein PF005_g18884 [Phytophthora fragariae]|uniref:RxLR effector protein n=1 Tax=Phytophthora fragariae TaxID=53985 RepID=A0A6A3EIX1_9STRA|nr:hypothetical protein PF003_g25630 [Phytophthora fragariae]KAE8930078.1 hypothetical protein PF009_g19822 [Phytophthora fragariae]KAE8983476.1 hypothetical protein PF011_g21169 [Phytophthora fragariae]KAE9091056.1 hypothetical protein PF010_g18346 [Phytophthora fragariae]KAE9091229.1 hypothetical protein PF007_g18958 [Phytophthora fragariae]
MRFTYILAVVIAATLHASSTALATTMDSTHASISSVASADIVPSLDAAQVNGGRMLRKVKEDPVLEGDDLDEERGGEGVFKWFKHHLGYLETSVKKRIPGTHENKLHRYFKKKQEQADFKRVMDGDLTDKQLFMIMHS